MNILDLTHEAIFCAIVATTPAGCMPGVDKMPPIRLYPDPCTAGAVTIRKGQWGKHTVCWKDLGGGLYEIGEGADPVLYEMGPEACTRIVCSPAKKAVLKGKS